MTGSKGATVMTSPTGKTYKRYAYDIILLFGGPDAMSNPGLTDDHVDANDKSFLTSFPYLASPH